MCGIFGAVNTNGYFGSRDFDRFVRLTEVVQSRGPDADGYLGLDFKKDATPNSERFNLFLGHRRLSIIDLSAAGNQPMKGKGNVWVTFNGEIFNYKELRQSYRARYSFRTCSDTEVILGAYETEGRSAFGEFNGEWAFALADLDRGEIILSRDRFSIKPLYYVFHEGILFFASEIKQLLGVVPEKRPNAKVLRTYLSQGLLDYSNETCFKHIFKVPPKQNLILSLTTGAICCEQYWDYTLDSGSVPTDLRGAAEGFHDLFEDSVRIRLRSDVKVGGLLSGGLDSSGICVTADRLQNGMFETYSVVPFSPWFTELPFINCVVSKASLRNTKLFVDESRIVMALENAIRRNDEPLGSFSAVAHYTMMEKIKAETDVKVILSGQGGDEVLLGYRKFFFFMLADLVSHGRLPRALWEVLSSLISRTVLWQFDVSEAQRYLWRSGRGRRPYLRAEEVRLLGAGGGSALHQIADLDLYSVPSLTHYEDRNSAGFGLEIRLPFLDYRLVNFCLNLADDLKIRNGWTKYVLRKALTAVPDHIRWRRDKQGFTLPEKVWLKDHLANLIRSMFKRSVLEELDIIDSKSFLKYYDDFRSGVRPIWYTDISRALMAELWARQHFLPATETVGVMQERDAAPR